MENYDRLSPKRKLSFSVHRNSLYVYDAGLLSGSLNSMIILMMMMLTMMIIKISSGIFVVIISIHPLKRGFYLARV